MCRPVHNAKVRKMSFLKVSLWAVALCYLVGLVSGGVLGRIGVASQYLEMVAGAVAMLLAFVFYKYSLNQGFSVLKWTRSDNLQAPISLGWLVTALAMTILMSVVLWLDTVGNGNRCSATPPTT